MAPGSSGLGGCAVSALALDYGTPLYVFCEDTLREGARAYRTALQRSYPAGGQIAYASKAYLCLALAQVMAEEGLNLDVVSGGELYVALRAGFPPGRIHFHGNNKSGAELDQALEAGVGRIVVDNFRELEDLARRAEGPRIGAGRSLDALVAGPFRAHACLRPNRPRRHQVWLPDRNRRRRTRQSKKPCRPPD